jgi:hypothetical protein
MSYTSDERDLQPMPMRSDANDDLVTLETKNDLREAEVASKIPIRVIQEPIFTDSPAKYYTMSRQTDASTIPAKTIFRGPILATALTIVIVLSLGFASFKNQSVYAVTGKHAGASGLTASAAAALGGIADLLERLLTRELVYERSQEFHLR